MARVKKDLEALNSTVSVPFTGETNGACAFQYAVGGAGTVVAEGSLNGTDWVVLTIINAATKADATSATAAGLYYVENIGYDVRIKKTVGTASCPITLSVTRE